MTVIGGAYRAARRSVAICMVGGGLMVSGCSGDELNLITQAAQVLTQAVELAADIFEGDRNVGGGGYQPSGTGSYGTGQPTMAYQPNSGFQNMQKTNASGPACKQMYDNAQICKQRMGGGAQTEYYRSCYNQYMNHYNACLAVSQ